MIKIKLNEQWVQVEKGTKIIELCDKANMREQLVCQVGAQVKELNYALSEKNDGMTIKFLGLDHIEATRAYEATLRYVVAMAFYNIYPDVNIRFSYNVSRSIFCEPVGKNFNMSRAVEPIKTEVKRLIDADLKIERVTLSINEANKLYKKFGFKDKAKILKYRPENIAHVYKCGDYYNYMHSYMLASTGCLGNYTITPYSPGIIIQYPRYELNAQIPKFVEEATYGKTLQQAYRIVRRSMMSGN